MHSADTAQPSHPPHPFATALGANALLAGMPSEAVARFAAEIPCVRYDDGMLIFNEGDPAAGLYLVVEGAVRISKQGRGGKQETLGTIEAGNYFGEMGIVDHQPRSAQATALGTTMVGILDETTLHQIIQACPGVSMNLVRCIVGRLRNANTHFIEEMMRSERLSLVGSMANGIIHDFKNPMAAILCACDFLSTNTDPTIQQLTGIMQRSVERMVNMTQELLDFARGTTAQKWTRAPVGMLVEAVEETALRPMEENGFRVERSIAFHDEVVLDFDRFERVLGNLVKNAREAMEPGGRLRFALSATPESVLFEITDSGCGIPEEILPTIFEPFVTHGKKNGTGLGMALVKQVVDGHRGTIDIDSQRGVGTTMQLQIPRNLQPATES